MTAGRAGRRTSSCSSATACPSPTVWRRACSQRASRRARRAANSPSTTCRIWRWLRPRAAIRSLPIRPIPPAPMRPATSRRSTPWGSMPIAPSTRSTIPRSRPSPVWSSADMGWRSASSPIEIEDATPAAMVAHVRRRSEYDRIVEQFFAAKPDVIMGGGRANFLPKSVEGGKRRDDSDFVAQFRDAGYGVASTGPEMTSLADDAKTTKLLGLFTLGNMNGALDRKILKGGTVGKFPQQPDLTEQVSAAL